MNSKIALITGPSSEIGVGILRNLIGRGYFVILIEKNKDLITSIIKKLDDCREKVDFCVVDLCQVNEIVAAVNSIIEKYGQVNLLINNARFREPEKRDFLSENEDSWDMTMGVNLRSHFFLCQQISKKSIAEGFNLNIINIASISGRFVSNESPAYQISKAGLIHLTRYLAVTTSKYNIRVNCIMPGMIVKKMHTERFDSIENETYRNEFMRSHSVPYPGDETDIANAVDFLSDEKSKFINGECLVVDGGVTIQDTFATGIRSLKQ